MLRFVSARAKKSTPPPAPMDLPAELARMLAYMRKRPGMFFPEDNYLRHFQCMCVGYELCARVSGSADHFDLGQPFAEWLLKRLRVSGGYATGWTGVISRKYPDHEEAYDRFFDLLAEYRGWPPLVEA